MTKQEILNEVWDYFIINQNQLSKSLLDNSFYKSEMDCPIGILMPELIYNVEMEGVGFRLVCQRFPKVVEYFGEDNIEFLVKIQELHDTSENIEEFGKQLYYLADAYGLIIVKTTKEKA